MPKPKKTKGKRKKGKGKGKKTKSSNSFSSSYPSVLHSSPFPFPPSSSPPLPSFQAKTLLSNLPIRTDLIYLNLQCVGWKFGSIELTSSITTTLSIVALKITQTYGPLTSLRLYHSSPTPGNELIDLTQTLEQLGCEGGSRVQKKTYLFYYDFTPVTSNPIIMREPFGWINLFSSTPSTPTPLTPTLTLSRAFAAVDRANSVLNNSLNELRSIVALERETNQRKVGIS